jgi:hypothetical protein
LDLVFHDENPGVVYTGGVEGFGFECLGVKVTSKTAVH